MGDQTGANNPNWRGGRVVEPRGYVLVRVGKGHPLADCRGYAYEHRLKAYEAGSLDPDGPLVHVHHDDEDRGNNDPGNLEPLPLAAHMARHRRSGRRLRNPGEPNPEAPCACGCGISLLRFDRHGRYRRFIAGHNLDHQSPTTNAILAALQSASAPMTPTEIARATGKSTSVVKTTLWRLKVRDVVSHASRGQWTTKES